MLDNALLLKTTTSSESAAPVDVGKTTSAESNLLLLYACMRASDVESAKAALTNSSDTRVNFTPPAILNVLMIS